MNNDLKIGNTPLVELKKIKEKFKLKANIYAKVERFNQFGSIKDRVALQMIKDAFENGRLKEGTTIIEPTSGNTGIALAALAPYFNLKCIICMPSNMSNERKDKIIGFNAELVLTSPDDGMSGSIIKANELKKSIPNSFIPDQFNNASNPKAHYLTTAKEIDKSLNGDIDILISAIGSGGTITGCSRYFKDNNINVKVIGVEPYSSPYINKGIKGPHKIQGIGAGFIPSILDLSIIDEVKMVKDEDAYLFTRIINDIEGLGVGISSGAALKAVIIEAQKEENLNKNIVVIFPDGIENYLSSDLFKS